MKHSKITTLISAALLSITAAVISPCLTAAAETGQNQTPDGLYYTIDPVTNEATITGIEYKYDRDHPIAVNIPAKIGNATVTAIGENAFSCVNLNQVTIPNTVKTIGQSAFLCTKMEDLVIPASVTIIDQAAFMDNWFLQSVKIQGAATIKGSAFKNCKMLDDLSLSESIPFISSWAFESCSALEAVSIPGKTGLGRSPFYNCTSLKNITLSDQCYSPDDWVYTFDHSTALATINDKDVLLYQTDSNGNTYPVINPALHDIVYKCFKQSIHVGFVDTYCTDLCKYIVKTETSYDPDSEEQTNDWMNDALKARQLHDWLVRHCDGEDGFTSDEDNHLPSSVFLSYGLNERGEGIGESVCEGYAKAYTMLLATANIESYLVYSPGHEWNLVKIGDEYYHVDLTEDDPMHRDQNDQWVGRTYATPYSTDYTCFLKSIADLQAMNPNKYANPQRVTLFLSDHELLEKYSKDITKDLTRCTESYPDANRDGILDNDFDLDGVGCSHDLADDTNALQGFLRFAYGFNSTPEQINDRLPEVLAELHALKKGYWDYVNDAAPVSASVPNGGTAEFKVTLFGENLYYQWFLYVEKYNRWDYIENANGISPTLYWNANEYSNGNQFVCRIMNQDGYYLYSTPVTLTVT